jgi:hypothetical protein
MKGGAARKWRPRLFILDAGYSDTGYSASPTSAARSASRLV